MENTMTDLEYVQYLGSVVHKTPVYTYEKDVVNGRDQFRATLNLVVGGGSGNDQPTGAATTTITGEWCDSKKEANRSAAKKCRLTTPIPAKSIHKPMLVALENQKRELMNHNTTLKEENRELKRKIRESEASAKKAKPDDDQQLKQLQLQQQEQNKQIQEELRQQQLQQQDQQRKVRDERLQIKKLQKQLQEKQQQLEQQEQDLKCKMLNIKEHKNCYPETAGKVQKLLKENRKQL